MPESELLWTDRKRILGIPIGLTKYSLTESRLFIYRGLLNTTQDEVMLYRLKDFKVQRTFLDRILGVGSIKIASADPNEQDFWIEKIRDVDRIKEMLYYGMLASKKQHGVHPAEFIRM